MAGRAGVLPDISGIFNYYRALADKYLLSRNYRGCIAALDNSNASLGEGYIITKDEDAYQKLSRERRVFQCGHCTMQIDKVVNQGERNEHTKQKTIPTEVPASDIKVFEYLLPAFDEFVTGKKSVNVWRCPECDELNMRAGSNIIKLKTLNPFYTDIIGLEPRRGYGLATRQTHDLQSIKYCHLYMRNLTHQEALYRQEYITKNGHDMVEAVYQDKGDGGK